MISFPAEKEERLLAARLEFRDALLANDLFVRTVNACVVMWGATTNPEARTDIQPSIMPGSEDNVPGAIIGGAQVGFKQNLTGRTTGIYARWYFVDLFAYRPDTVGYDVSPKTPVITAAPSQEVTQLYETWRTAVNGLLGKFGKHDLLINRHTGEIDLRENIDEGKMRIILPNSQL